VSVWPLALAALIGVVAADALAERTNVNLIVADDLGWGDLGCWSCTAAASTPPTGCVAPTSPNILRS